MSVINTECSGCFVDVVLRTTAGTATASVASNGRRGSLHVPSHTVEGYIWVSDFDDDLLRWECPVCGYPDSYDINA